MKILWFSNTPALGEEYINEKPTSGGWLKSLDKAIQNKIELHVAFYSYKVMDDFKYNNTFYHHIQRGNNKLDIIKHFFCTKEIDKEHLNLYLEIINKVKPDIIHIHGSENSFGCIIDYTDIPVVISIQGNITVCLHKYCSGVEKKYLNTLPYIKSIKSLLSGVYPLKKSFKSFGLRSKIEIENLKKCKYIIGRTDWDRRITSILAPNSRYFYGGEILRDLFYVNKWIYHSDRNYFVVHTTNGNALYKGFETICEVVTLLNNMGIKFIWQVAGLSDNSIVVKTIKSKLGERYPKYNLQLLGTLKENNLVDHMLNADMFVATSHIENSPNNLCEAMMLGMPCIATFAGGTGSILKDKKEGLLVQDGDPWVMAGAVLELRNNIEQAIIYGNNAREIALRRHCQASVSEDYLTIYKKIITLDQM